MAELLNHVSGSTDLVVFSSICPACSWILGDILWPSRLYGVEPPPFPDPCLQFSRLQDPDSLKSAGLLPPQNDYRYGRPL